MRKLNGQATGLMVAIILIVASSALPAHAQTKVRYVEVVRNLAYLPSYVAMAKGYFKGEGLDISLSTAQGGDKVSALMLSNNADIALVGPETAVYVKNSKSPTKLQIFSALTGTSTNFLMARKAPAREFKWSIVKGTTVLGWRPGSTPELFLEYAMRKHGLDPKKDVNLITNVAVPARIGAWLAGTGEFSIFSEPDATVIEKQGKGQRVTFVGREVGKVDYTVFVASDDYIKRNATTVQAFTNAIYKAQRLPRRPTRWSSASSPSSIFRASPSNRLPRS